MYGFYGIDGEVKNIGNWKEIASDVCMIKEITITKKRWIQELHQEIETSITINNPSDIGFLQEPLEVRGGLGNNILDPLSVWYDMKFNKVYRCFSCGMLLVPKFENNEKHKIISFRQCGWWKIKSSYGGKRYMCHHCVEHRNSYTHEDDINEWNKYVKVKNTFLINQIKRDNMKFYVKYVKDKNWVN